MKYLAQWAESVGVRKSSRRKGTVSIEKNKLMDTIRQPMTSSAEWYKELVKYHLEVSSYLDAHNPVIIQPSATSLRNCIAVALERAASESRKEAPLRHVSEDAFVSDQSYYWFSTDAAKLFDPDVEPGTNIYKILVDRVEKLKKALISDTNFFKLVERNPKNDDDISLHNIKMLRV